MHLYPKMVQTSVLWCGFEHLEAGRLARLHSPPHGIGDELGALDVSLEHLGGGGDEAEGEHGVEVVGGHVFREGVNGAGEKDGELLRCHAPVSTGRRRLLRPFSTPTYIRSMHAGDAAQAVHIGGPGWKVGVTDDPHRRLTELGVDLDENDSFTFVDAGSSEMAQAGAKLLVDRGYELVPPDGDSATLLFLFVYRDG